VTGGEEEFSARPNRGKKRKDDRVWYAPSLNKFQAREIGRQPGERDIPSIQGPSIEP
jgi:hypothetical protein